MIWLIQSIPNWIEMVALQTFKLFDLKHDYNQDVRKPPSPNPCFEQEKGEPRKK